MPRDRLASASRPRRRAVGRQSSSALAWVFGLGFTLLALLVLGAGGVALHRHFGGGASARPLGPGQGGWCEVASGPGQFRAHFPAPPTVASHQRPTAIGPVSETIHELNTTDLSVMISYADFTAPGQATADLLSVMQRARADVARSLGGVPVTDRAIQLGHHSGWELTVATPRQGFAYLRWYVVGRRMYALGYTGPRVTAQSTEPRRFFDSFQLTP